MDADGSDVRRLTETPSFDAVPTWSPDGEWIAFASDRDATPAQRQAAREDSSLAMASIYVMRAHGSEQSLLLDRGNDVIFPLSWTNV